MQESFLRNHFEEMFSVKARFLKSVHDKLNNFFDDLIFIQCGISHGKEMT
jgi:hypothetical protein